MIHRLMKRVVIVLVLGAALPALAAEKRLTVGVFLPTVMTDGQERFSFAEKLASTLETALGQPVSGRSFGRYEDFARAAGDGTLDVAVLEGWAAAESSFHFELLSLGVVAGETHQRWALISRRKGPVNDLRGKRLALTKGAGSYDPKFVTNAIFAGDLNARLFKLVPVPSVESALKMLEVNSAESALVPVAHVPKDAQVLYRSRAFPAAVVVSFHGKGPEMQAAFHALGKTGPFDKFVAASASEVADLRQLILRGPGRRQPMIAESPIQRPDPAALVDFREVGSILPSFVESMELPKDQPDD